MDQPWVVEHKRSDLIRKRQEGAWAFLYWGIREQSDTINLDDYVDKKVTVKGDLVKGYPVDGGPDYLNVKSIQ